MESIRQVLNPQGCQCSPEIRQGVIRKLSFLESASDATVEHLVRSLRSRSAREGQEISPLQFRSGLFGVVVDGAFKVYRHVQDNQVVVFDVLTKGDFFLYSASDLNGMRMYTYPDIVQAMTTSCLLFTDQEKLMPALTRDIHLVQSFFEVLADRLRRSNEHFIRFLAFRAEHRLAYLLRFLHSKGPRKPGYPGLIPFNLPRKDLAAMSGLTMETTSRILSAFEKDGLIRSGRGWVEIVDFEGLEHYSQIAIL